MNRREKLSDARDDITVFFEKGTFPFKGNLFKAKKRRIKKEPKIALDILGMNQRTLTMICLKIILIFQYLLLC